MSIGDFPESLSQQIVVGIILVGRLGAKKRNFWAESFAFPFLPNLGGPGLLSDAARSQQVCVPSR